ncbi:carbon starvation protein A [Pirellula sp. SH-Sr6A]|uniref:carbon starvation CstA family protein n=1 Tax=Pirellula sp. SH-Sr6A TaxID=1632865 RepID=UPI0011BAAB98|nr:carbon starvation protein A [Pirellula sp. SH-Sr6A]
MMHAMPIMLGVLAAMAVAYRYYSAFLAARVASLDESRATPAQRLDDGQNYHPTNRWILFGHHFAAISGAGPLIGPVLAIQFGYMPGLIWLIVGVCLAGAVQDFLVLAASVRHDGKSLAEIARSILGPTVGWLASLAILFIVIIALSGLGVVVVKALGGEQVNLLAGAKIEYSGELATSPSPAGTMLEIPEGSKVIYPRGESTRSERFTIRVPEKELAAATAQPGSILIPAKSVELIKGSSWGTFTIFCTIPIALFVGLYMYRFRRGHIVEASLIGAIGVLGATVAGNWIPGSWLEPYFSLSREGITLSICLYGFIASVLPVWLLLCPRDYLSSFLKIGTIGVLIGGILIANPRLEAPAWNEYYAGGGGPYFSGAVFPFVFICIMCGAISGFHALVSSGTTPKMVSNEKDIRLIGYGSMLMEGLVAVCALIAAASLPAGDYWAINIDLSKIEKHAEILQKMNADTDHLQELERQVGGETLRGRTGGAVTLAVGMSKIMTDSMQRFSSSFSMDGVVKYWFHFAIMFEALFILTTIDTGTRIARFLLQEILGKLHPQFAKMDWMPGVLISTALVTLGWGSLIWSSSIDTIWPMFGIANQLLAGIALCVVTAWMFQSGRGKWWWTTVIPLCFIALTTLTASAQMITGNFLPMFSNGLRAGVYGDTLRGGLCTAAILFLIICFVVIVIATINRCVEFSNRPKKEAT